MENDDKNIMLVLHMDNDIYFIYSNIYDIGLIFKFTVIFFYVEYVHATIRVDCLYIDQQVNKDSVLFYEMDKRKAMT